MGLGSWAFVVCDRGGVPLTEPIATARTYSPSVSGTETASFQVRVGSPLWDVIETYTTTLKVYDTFQDLVFYGDIVTDDLDLTQSKEVAVNAVDVSARLADRLAGKDATGVGLRYDNQDARAIAFDLLKRTNAEAPTGILPGSGDVGLSTDPAFVPAVTTFGKTTLGASQVGMAGDYYRGAPIGHPNLQVAKYTLGVPGTVTALNADFGANPAVEAFGAEYVELVLYADSQGAPAALLATTAQKRLSDGVTTPHPYPRQWTNFPTTSTPTLQPGDYWMGHYAGESSLQIAIGYDGGGTRYYKNQAYGTLGGTGSPGVAPATFGSAPSDSFGTFAIHADITTAPDSTPSSFVGPTVTYLWKPLLDAIAELGAMADSYEWKVRYVDGTPPTCYLDLVSFVGTDRSSTVFFESGVGQNNCTLFKRTRSSRGRITRAYALGTGQTLTAVAFDAAAEAVQYARAETVLSVGDITDTTLLDALAAQHVAIRKTPRVVASMSLEPEIAPKYGEWAVGDYVTARGLVEGSLVVNGKARIWSAQINIDEEGNEIAAPNVEPSP